MGKKKQSKDKEDKKAKEEEQALKKKAKEEERKVRSEFRREKSRKMYGKEEWDEEFKKFLKKLIPLGYFVREVTGDGNCFFRSIADQLEIEGMQHQDVRARIVQYITEHRTDFEPFIEDDVPFDRYISAMARNGTWGGNLELQACSMAFTVNVKIFQADLPCWDVVNWPPPSKTLFLSYHDGDHWNSVRPLATLTAQESAKISTLLGIKILSGSSQEEIAEMMRSEYGKEETTIPQPVKAEKTKEERIVMESTGEEDIEKVRGMLAAYDNDTGAVILEIYRMRYDEDDDYAYIDEGGGRNGSSDKKEYVILSTSTESDDSKGKKKRHLTKKQMKEQKKAQKRNLKVDDPSIKVTTVNGAGDALIPSQKI